MIHFEANIDFTHQQKWEKYENLFELCIKNSWSTEIFPLETGCRFFLFELNLNIFNQTRTFTRREEGIYKKRPKTRL